MRTISRLNKVYKNAKIIPFDDTSKLVFFSDTHRGDDSASDEFGKNKHIFYQAINHYYHNGFTYVEVGDGDELWEHKNFEHIRNGHFSIFNKLKEIYDDGRMLMIFGNHNMEMKDPQWVKKNMYEVYDDYLEEKTPLFPGLEVYEAIRFQHKDTKQELFVVHGHQGDLLNDQLAPFTRFMIRFFWHFVHHLGFSYAASPAKSRRKRHKVEKNYSKWNAENNTIIICGHTHRPRFPNPGESAYFNSGCGMHPRGITCLELVDGKFTLVTWRVHSKQDGILFIKRTVLKGPVSIREYSKNKIGDDLHDKLH